MEYIECYACGPPSAFQWVLIAAMVVAAFLEARKRNWTFVAALLGVPLAVWFTDDLPTALVTFVFLLIGVLSGTWYGSRRTKPSASDAV